MALRLAAPQSLLSVFTPQLSHQISAIRTNSKSVLSAPLSRTIPSLLALAVPPAFQLRIPSLLSDIWESVLKAVPKKKTSHMKKRHRFMAGKALKDVTELNKCSACGNVKRAHLLCPYCVREIRDLWLGKKKPLDKDPTAS